MNKISVRFKEYGEKFKDFWNREDGILLIFSILIGFITHFYLFTHEVMAPDMVGYSSLYTAGDWEVSLGRWGIQIINGLRGGMINSFLITIVCILGASLSVIFIRKIFEIESRIISLLFATVIMTAPQMAETLLFTFTADAYFCAILLSCLAAYMISRTNIGLGKYLLAGICIIFSLSIYQTYIGLTIGIIIILFIHRLLKEEDTKENVKWFIKNMCFILICLILYFLITKIYLYANGLELASYRGANSFGIDILFQIPESVIKIYRQFVEFLFGESVIYNQFWKRNILNGIITGILFLCLVHQIIREKIYHSPTRLLLLVVAILLFPLGVNIIGIIMPTTGINLVIGYAEILYYILFFVVIEKEIRLLRIPSYVAVTILCGTFILSNNATYMARYDVFQNYYTESIRILSKVEMLDGYSNELKWMFSDNIQYVSAYSKMANGFISNNYMTWSAAKGIWLNKPFYKKYFGKKINMVTYEQHNAILESEEFQNMGIYPENDSIRIIDDIIVIKLSENGSQVQ